MRPDRRIVRAWIALNRRTRWLPGKLVEAVGVLIAAWRGRAR